MAKVLVDASVVIDYLRRPDREKSNFARIRGVWDMVMSFVTVTELYSGMSSKDKETAGLIDEIVDSCEIRYVNLKQSKQAGMMRRDYKLLLGDSYIAQLAIEDGLPLATLNNKDFRKVKGLKFWGGRSF